MHIDDVVAIILGTNSRRYHRNCIWQLNKKKERHEKSHKCLNNEFNQNRLKDQIASRWIHATNNESNQLFIHLFSMPIKSFVSISNCFYFSCDCKMHETITLHVWIWTFRGSNRNKNIIFEWISDLRPFGEWNCQNIFILFVAQFDKFVLISEIAFNATTK